jgi:hypothetical protein
MQRAMSISNSSGRFSTLRHLSFSGISIGLIVIARGGQMNSHSWQETHFSLPFSSTTSVGAPRYHSGMLASHFSSGYCMVTIPLLKRALFKCFQVMASPAKSEGK